MSKRAQKTGIRPSRNIRRLVLVTILVAIFALGATAAVSLRKGSKQPSTPAAPAAKTNAAPSNPGYRAGAAFTAQTGQVRPLTQEEAQKLAAGLKELVNQSTDGLQSVRHADGSVSMDLQGHFQNVALAKLDENGNLIQSCVDNPESAAAFFGLDPQLLGVTKTTNTPKPDAAAAKGEER